ncbi:MAG TPA: histidine triad nucleotide-binding protein [Firmicutes bacterium]|nr:histidine triad nucleotide-binding protein [Bacillota bacterium]
MGECPFCQIIQGKARAIIVLQNEDVIAINDINPQAPVHILFIPKRHYENVVDAMEQDGSVVERLFRAAIQYAKSSGLSDRGFRFVINCGRDGGQTVPHLHLHLLGDRQMTWPPG